ncbi:Ig-like domain-containing protein [Arthrobacter sp. NPDC093128]|uniref:Ig-like domain-containing protein n=1 Tax=Arthrobacter sp. NPDC093128 TaxID=3154979 RepID=UPI0034260A46
MTLTQQPEPRHPRGLFRRAPWVLPGILLLSAGLSPAAHAFWESVSSSNFAGAAADSLSPAAKPAVAATGAALSVTWPASATAAGRPATGYAVTRYSAATGGSGIPATGACAGTVTALSCTEQNVPGGIWYYTVTPAIALWTGAESPRSDGVSSDSAAPTVTTSISPTPNAAGWNNTSPVTLTISADDGANGSGVASITYTLDAGASVTVNAATTAIPVTGDGNHTVSYSAADNAGNASTTQTRNIRIDTAAPGVASLSVPAYVNSTNVTAVPVIGTAEPGSTVSLTVHDAGSVHTVTATTTASGTGSWSVTPNLSALSQGTVSYSAVATDAAGNTGTATTATDIKDTIAPAVPTLSVPAYVNNANATAVPVSGTAEAGASLTLTVKDPGAAHNLTATTTASGTGAWSFTALNLSTLNQGTVSYSVAATDAAGNSASPAVATGTKDTVAPVAPGLNAPPYVNSATAASVQVTGTSEAGATVSLTVADTAGHTVSRTAVASGTGAWTVTGLNLTSFSDGQITYTAAAADLAGNTGPTYTSPGPNSKDAVVPTMSTTANAVRLMNGGAVGTADAGDTLTIQYSEAMDASKFCSVWDNNGIQTLSANNDVSVTVSHSTTANTLAVVSKSCTLNIGAISLGADADYAATTTAVVFAGVNANVSTVSWNPATNSLIIKLGSTKNGTGTLGTGIFDYPAYTPMPTLTDLAGNPISTTAYTSGTKTGF